MARLTRADWIEAAHMVVTRDPEAVLTIDGLCQDLGATKGSFYHHFRDREDLLLELDAIRARLLEEIAQVGSSERDPESRFRAYCVGAFTSREYLHLEAFLERERVTLREVDKVMQQADDAAHEWQLRAVRDLGYSAEDAPRYLSVLKAAAMGMVFFMMHEGRTFTLDERVEFANTLADMAVASASDC